MSDERGKIGGKGDDRTEGEGSLTGKGKREQKGLRWPYPSKQNKN